MSTPEGIVKNAICSWLSTQGCFFFIHDSVGVFDPVRKRFRVNNSPYRVRGVADILGIWNGKPLAIEVKSEKGKLSEHQKLFLLRWQQAGGIAIVARSIDEVRVNLKQTGGRDESSV